jgi:hypothetical protein
MRISRMNRRRAARFQKFGVAALLVVSLTCHGRYSFAQDGQSAIDGLLADANHRLGNGESVPSVEAWLATAMHQSGLSIQSAPSSWDSYARAKWQRDATSDPAPSGHGDTRTGRANSLQAIRSTILVRPTAASETVVRREKSFTSLQASSAKADHSPTTIRLVLPAESGSQSATSLPVRAGLRVYVGQDNHRIFPAGHSEQGALSISEP